MAMTHGTWYVRFPDGRVLLAKSTQAVRYHIERGRIPANSRVRRSTEESWQNIDSAPEFADLLEQPSSSDVAGDGRVGMGKSSVEFRVFGVAASINELFSAIDLSLHRNKLWIAGIAALIWAVGVAALILTFEIAQGLWLFGLITGISVALLFAAGFASSAIGQMTLVEMLHRRRARWKEIRPRLLLNAFSIFLGEALFLGVTLLPIEGLRHMPRWWEGLFSTTPPEALTDAVQTARLILEIVFWPLQGMLVMLGPIIIVEECSLTRGFAKWWELIRSDLSRVFLYETLAIALGVVLTLPLIAPILHVAWEQGVLGARHLATPAHTTLLVLGGLALSPFATYMLVANVFIYLNLRYEFYSPK